MCSSRTRSSIHAECLTGNVWYKITALCSLVASTLKEVVQQDKKGGWTGLEKYSKHQASHQSPSTAIPTLIHFLVVSHRKWREIPAEAGHRCGQGLAEQTSVFRWELEVEISGTQVVVKLQQRGIGEVNKPSFIF